MNGVNPNNVNPKVTPFVRGVNATATDAGEFRTAIGAGTSSFDGAYGSLSGTPDLSAKADLVGGVVPTSQIPSVAITEYLGEVADQTAMLALSAGDRGDWCVRTDTGSVWVLVADDSSLIASWTQLTYPAAPVTSVNSLTGAVVLAAADVGAAATSHTHIIDDVTGLQDALNAKAATATTLAGYGITDAINVSAIGVTVQAFDADTAKLDEAQVWPARQIPGSSAITFASSITDDLDANGLVRTLTLTGDVTTFAVSNGTNYQVRRYYILQDGTGGHTITFSGIDGTEPTIDTDANALTVFEIEYVPGTGARFV